MPEYRIHEEHATVSIELTDIEGKQDELLQAFGECQSGKCSCPTDQYDKVADMKVLPDRNQITIRLEPTAGERFNTDEIAACLDYTIARTETPRQ